MRFTQILALASAVLASPISRRWTQEQAKFPLTNGFPHPKADAVSAIEAQAQGTIPDIVFPTSISDKTALVFSLIATNELAEVAYFTSLLYNISTKQSGYEHCDQQLFDSLVAIQAQEEIHALGANGILKAAGRPVIEPCKYTFPVNNLEEAIQFATSFTDLVLGTLQTALTAFGADGDTEFLQLIGSVIGSEGEQEGLFRSTFGKIASEKPFLTVGGPVFAASALVQNVIVPGSCPTQLPIPVLAPLTFSTAKTETQILHFSFPGNSSEGLSLVYLSGQNKPIVEPITKSTIANGKILFDGTFQQQAQNLNGFTLAAIVKGSGPFTNASDVANAAVAGPAFIQVN
ncbi:MAG: hypothetical protein GOMPHAMPRED_006656 [Gomphillus americanus]|uniref:Sexual development protein n=1 Tax=Gomphillus americanus TaxID=1940652 RepID=A0A8H3FXG9_9LECA|nr:MAG: hypothetical protein GOMPHAMPRED_006656 [Gomphillus americanus]